MLNECRCKFYKRVVNETTTRCMRFICVYGIAGVSLFLTFASTFLISFFSFKFCLMSAFLFYSIRMLANLCKRLTITTNALLLIRMACNCLRICCEYAFITEFRNMFLIFAIPLERPECLRIRTNVWRCTCEHCDL